MGLAEGDASELGRVLRYLREALPELDAGLRRHVMALLLISYMASVDEKSPAAALLDLIRYVVEQGRASS